MGRITAGSQAPVPSSAARWRSRGDDDRQRARAVLCPNARATSVVVPSGIDLEAFRPSIPPPRPRRSFLRGFNYGPNEEGARWLAKRLAAGDARSSMRPSARVACTDQAVTSLAENRSVRVTGAVLRQPFLWNSAVAPHRCSWPRGPEQSPRSAGGRTALRRDASGHGGAAGGGHAGRVKPLGRVSSPPPGRALRMAPAERDVSRPGRSRGWAGTQLAHVGAAERQTRASAAPAMRSKLRSSAQVSTAVV
jgi:hypothetical protein